MLGAMLRVVGVTTCLWLLVGNASADEIPVIKLDASGPSQELPTRISFYLQGPAQSAIRARAGSVRVGSPSLFVKAVKDVPSCSEVFAKLGTKFQGGERELPELPTHTSRANEIWETSATYRVKVSTAWKPEGDPTT